MMDVPLLINGEYVGASSGKTYSRNNPLDGSVATTVAAAGVEDVDLAVRAASEAFKGWSDSGPNYRRTILNRAAEVIQDSKKKFVDAVVSETGGSAAWAEFNVHLATEMFVESAAITTQISGEVIPADLPGSLSMGVRVPAGVSVGIAPWNAPIVLGARAIAMPLACGNTAILRGSEICPATHALIADAVHQAGAPAGVINYINNDPVDAPAVVEALISNPETRRVNFTGSTKVGRIVARLCAEHLKPVVLELGGKAPLVILDDADIDVAVNSAVFGSFANSGQICMSTERIVLDNKVADRFINKLVSRVKELPCGDPRKGKVVLGSLVDMSAVERCNLMIDDAISKGAKLLCGGKSNNTLMAATLIDNVTPDMKIYSEEVFGPVRCIVRVDGVEEAIACANDTGYGLSAAVIGKDINRAMYVAKSIKSGICHINSATVYDEPQMPFGGVKDSGYGRFGGRDGIAAFTETRWLSVQTKPRAYPF